MTDFLNLSLFEMLVNSDFVKNLPNPTMVTYILCVLRIVMMWPLSHLFYKISLNMIYFLDRHKANRDGLRSRVINPFCYDDKWRYYDECCDAIHGFDTSLTYECNQCGGCKEGRARCKNIKFNDDSLKNHYRVWTNLGLILAFLMCNPLPVFHLLGFIKGCIVTVIALFINPIFVWLTYKIADLHIRVSDDVMIKEKHENPFENMFTEMFEDGAWYRYWNSLPIECRSSNPNIVLSSNIKGHRTDVQSNLQNTIRRQQDKRELHQAINNSPYRW